MPTLNLKEYSDIQLINKIKQENCSNSILELSSRHEGLIAQIARKHSYVQGTGCSVEDFMENKDYFIFDAAKNFKEDKNVKFTTWLGNKVRFFCLNTNKKQRKYYGAESVEDNEILMDNIANKDEISRKHLESEASYILNILDSLKDRRIKQIINLRYYSGNKNKSFSQISKALNMSKQGVINLHDNFIDFIKKKMCAQENLDQI